jgi:hypothetical protein
LAGMVLRSFSGQNESAQAESRSAPLRLVSMTLSAPGH